MVPLLRSATPQDGQRIQALLADSGLPTSDLEVARPHFVVACLDLEIVGAGALQLADSVALLRSVAVAPPMRGSGVGRQIVQALELQAHIARAHTLVLLTQTAREFFARLGYRVIEREAMPQLIQLTEEFRSLCPASATCMLKNLAARG
jgi:amino-acid N-acetyltransferase